MFCPYCGEKQKDNGSSVCHNCQSELGFVYLELNNARLEEKACTENASVAAVAAESANIGAVSNDSAQPGQAIYRQDSATDIQPLGAI